MTGVDSFLFVLFVLSCVNKTFGQANTAIGGQVKGHRVSHSFGLRSTPHTSSDSYQVSPLKDVMSNESTEHKHELFCRKMVEEHECRPGQGWGTMNNVQINRWKKIRCDKYFCKPNAMEARGSYKCEPIDATKPQVPQ
mmetsp:Transcript_29612/g.49998  ORF Transcript_29612/g.49998 Transcript_29612/m.49998 type:complete len:138 (+) Transcript_29612:210-623(+)